MQQVIPPLGEHAVVLLLLQLGLLLLVARTLGEVAVRLGLPSVVGELLAGIVLGPSLFGQLAPGVFAVVVPFEPEQFHLLEVVSLLGVLMLLIVTGMETDLELIARKGRGAAVISLTGIVIPFGTGVALGQLLPEQFIADPSQRLVFSLFLGTAMGISAIPVIAKVLIEMKVVRRDIGQITLAAGMIDDTIGWILLSVVAGLARSGVVEVGSVARSLLSVVAVVGLAFTLGRRFVERVFRFVDNRVGGDLANISLLMVLALLAASLTHALGIEAVLGAFLVGILVGRVKRFGRQARHVFETVALGVFAPIFFAASGLRVDLTAMADPVVMGIGLVVLAVAILGKFVGAALGGWLSGLGRWESLSLGAGMNARGAIEIIVATVGLSLGILTPEMYTIILMVAIVTSLMAPPILRWTLQKVPLSDEEAWRIANDQRRETSFLANLRRVLLPTRGGDNSRLAARLLGTLVLDEEVEVTTMSVLADRTDTFLREAEASLDAVESHLSHLRPVDRRRLVQHVNGSVETTILAEAGRGYDLLVVGASEPTLDGLSGDSLFGDLIDRLVHEAPVPVLVVRTPTRQGPEVRVSDRPIRRLLLPTTGNEASRHAAEAAAAIARRNGAVIDVLHVVEASDMSLLDVTLDGQDVARELVQHAADNLAALEVGNVATHVRRGARVEDVILAAAREFGSDLVVLSASRRTMSQRAFLGHRAERLLRDAPCPVVVVT